MLTFTKLATYSASGKSNFAIFGGTDTFIPPRVRLWYLFTHKNTVRSGIASKPNLRKPRRCRRWTAELSTSSQTDEWGGTPRAGFRRRRPTSHRKQCAACGRPLFPTTACNRTASLNTLQRTSNVEDKKSRWSVDERNPETVATTGYLAAKTQQFHFSRPWQRYGLVMRDISVLIVSYCIKAKFHYASWFGASSEPASVMEFDREPASSC